MHNNDENEDPRQPPAQTPRLAVLADVLPNSEKESPKIKSFGENTPPVPRSKGKEANSASVQTSTPKMKQKATKCKTPSSPSPPSETAAPTNDSSKQSIEPKKKRKSKKVGKVEVKAHKDATATKKKGETPVLGVATNTHGAKTDTRKIAIAAN